MNKVQLPSHLYYCFVGRERIFLDVDADSYFQLGPGEEAAFEAVETKNDGPGSAALVDGGLITLCGGGRPIVPTRHPPPTSSLFEGEPLHPRVRLAHAAEAGRDIIAAALAVRRREFGSLVRTCRGGQAAPLAVRTAAETAVAQFLAARRFVPIAPNCLRDSIGLRRFLARRGIDADVVIGVKLHPFAAHCWVQRHEVVLNDSLAAATGFSPILIL